MAAFYAVTKMPPPFPQYHGGQPLSPFIELNILNIMLVWSLNIPILQKREVSHWGDISETGLEPRCAPKGSKGCHQPGNSLVPPHHTLCKSVVYFGLASPDLHWPLTPPLWGHPPHASRPSSKDTSRMKTSCPSQAK